MCVFYKNSFRFPCCNRQLPVYQVTKACYDQSLWFCHGPIHDSISDHRLAFCGRTDSVADTNVSIGQIQQIKIIEKLIIPHFCFHTNKSEGFLYCLCSSANRNSNSCNSGKAFFMRRIFPSALTKVCSVCPLATNRSPFLISY